MASTTRVPTHAACRTSWPTPTAMAALPTGTRRPRTRDQHLDHARTINGVTTSCRTRDGGVLTVGRASSLPGWTPDGAEVAGKVRVQEVGPGHQEVAADAPARAPRVAHQPVVGLVLEVADEQHLVTP